MLNLHKSLLIKLFAVTLGIAIIEIADAASPDAKDTKPKANQEKKLATTSAKPLASKPKVESKVLSALIDSEIEKKA